MKILVIEHHKTSAPDMVSMTCKDEGFEVQSSLGLEKGTHHSDYHGLVVMGGAMDALDDEQCPYFPDLIDLIKDFANENKPVLGICLGSQLIARAFKAELRLAGELELGFHTITPHAEAANDPVFSHLEHPLPLFQWHEDHYDLPEGATHLASSDNYQNQAYRIGKTVYATQFHHEVTRELIEYWISVSPDIKEMSKDWMDIQIKDHIDSSNAFCQTFIKNWLKLAPV